VIWAAIWTVVSIVARDRLDWLTAAGVVRVEAVWVVAAVCAVGTVSGPRASGGDVLRLGLNLGREGRGRG
jgi:hypothetical protein